jgi:bifunctional DNase/RNase
MVDRRTALWAAAIFGLLVVVAGAGCAGRHDSGPAPGQVRVEVAHVGFDNRRGAHYLLLEDRSGKRKLEILIGDQAARAIVFEMRGIKPRTGNHLDRVVITRVHDQIYYAEIVLDDGRLRIDSRPSDAIALAMGLDAPIFVNGHLLQGADGLAGGLSSHASLPATVETEGISVQELSVPIAKYFSRAPQSGVLVAEVSGPAASAGLRSGDIVTAVGKNPVHAPADFVAMMAAARDAPAVTLSVIRGGHNHSISIKHEKIARRDH